MRKFYLKQLLLATAILFAVDVYAQCPTITLGSNPTVCSGTSIVPLSYTATTGFPNQYRIDWATLTDVPNRLFASSPTGGTIDLHFFLPPSAGTYSGTLYVRTATCESIGYSFSVTFTPGPAVTGVTWPNVCQGTSSTTLSFTTSGSPNQYSIDWYPDSNTAGLIDVPLTTIPGGPVPINNVPSIAGTYYGALYVKSTATGCTSSPWGFAVVVGSNITLGSNPNICFGSTTGSLSYSAATLGANQYRIDWDATANTAGFSDLSWNTLPASPITLSGIPSVSGTYSGNLFVRNSSLGCESSGKPFSVIIGPTITLGSNPITCLASFVSISYTTTTGSPNQYRIDWDNAANAAGIADVSLSPFPGGSVLNFGNIPAPVGTYYGTLFVKSTGSGCESPGYPVNVTVTNKPTITPGPNPNVCSGISTAPLTYSATTGSPNQYYIDWDLAANGNGLVDVPITSLPPSPITITGIPTSPPGIGITFLGILYVKNSGLGCVSTGSPISVTTIQTSIGLGAPPTICQGVTSSSVTYSSTVGSPNQYRIDWNAAANSAGMVDVPLTTLPPSPIPYNGIPTTAGTYSGNLFVRNSTNGCESVAFPVSVNVNGVTGGTVLANQIICSAGNPVAFTQSVWSTGSGALTYQWQTSADNINFTNIASATGTTYDVPAGLLNTTYYRRTTSSLLNSVSCNANSNTLTVTVNTPVTGGTIAADQTICSSGDPVAFSQTAAATGGGTLTYQWFSSLDNINFNYISGATSITYDPTVTMSSVTRYYRRTTIATQNGIGCPGNSNALTVLVNSVTSGTVSGAQTFCPGGSNPVPFTEMTAATGTGTLSYQWQSRLPFGSFSNIPGATNNTYDVPMVVTQDTYYSRVATSTVNGISCSATSNNVPIFINMVTGGTVAASQVICSGGNPAAFTQTLGSTYSGTVAYQWQSSGDNVSFNDISGATGITYDVPAGVTSTTYYKRVTRSTFNGVVCSATSNTLTITVNPLFGGVVGTDQSICQGSDPAAFTQISPSTGSGTLTYQWQSSLNGSSYSNIPSATNTVYDVPVGLTQTTYYRRITNATNGSLVCTTTSNNGIPLTVTVNPSTAITTHPSTTPQAVCQNGALTALMIAATGAGTLTYQWYSNTANSNTGGTLINGATSTSYTPSSTTTGTKYYYATATGSCGTATSSVSGAVTVKPFPSVYAYATNPTICSGSFTSMNAYGADSYSWSPATGLSATTGPSVIASPISTTTYTVTGTAINGCVNSSTVTVTVNSVVVSVNPLSPSKCHGSPAITLTASGALTYSWSPSTGLSATTGSIVTANPTATTTYTITGTNSNGCVGTVPVTVTVIPPISAVITPASSTTFCAGQSISVVLNANTGANLIYQWIKNGVNIPGATQSSYTASQVGLYQVTVTNTLAPCFITSLGVSVSVQTTGTILMNGDLCENGYTILSTKPGSGHLWSTGSTSSTITVYEPGTFSVNYISVFGCDVYGEITVVREGSNCIFARIGKEPEPEVEEVEEIKTLGVYPNPANDEITAQIDGLATYNLEVNLISQFGHQVGSSTIKKGENKTTMDTRNLANGVYIVVVKSARGFVIRQKVLVQHR